MGHIQGRNGNQIFGDWTNNPNGSTRFSATLAAAGGGGGATPVAGATKTVSEPAPGTSVSFSSPHPLPPGCPTAAFRAPASLKAGCAVGVTVTNTAGDLGGTGVVAEGDVTLGELVGQLVVTCWLFWDPDPEDGPLDAREQLSWCLAMVKGMVQRYKKDHRVPASTAGIRVVAASAPAHANAAGCRTQRLAFSVRAGKVKPVAAKLTARSVRYSCTLSGGTMKLRVNSRVSGGLRASLGPKLDLKLVRSKKAHKPSGKVKFAFNW
jgi:hypothetical protein